MDSQKNNPSLTEVLTDSVRNIAGTIGVLGGISFITGYLIVNFYLTQYGVATLNLVQSRYFASGALYLIVSALVCGAPLASIYTAEQLSKAEHESHTRKLMPALIGASFLLAALICWACGIVLVSADRFTPFARSITERQYSIWLALPASEIAILFPFFVYLLTKKAFKNNSPAQTSSGAIWLPATFAVLFIICFIISTVVFSRFVYANTSPSVGGGAPIKVQLVVTENLSSVQNFPLKINGGITEKVILIDNSGSELIVLQPGNNQVIEISNNQVLSILH
jgi:hypothetical protein